MRLQGLTLARMALSSLAPLVVSCAAYLEPPHAPAPPTSLRNVLETEVTATSAASAPQVAPTWSTIYEQYFAAKTDGSCSRSGA